MTKGLKSNKPYFEGYYYKHQKGDNMISFICGKSTNEEFIQVITKNKSYIIPHIGDNVFSKSGIKINVNQEDIKMNGEIFYGELTPIKYDIMGPFKFFPMECRHTVISMNHKLKGELNINGETLNFDNGRGYIEGDSGISFPSAYLWIHCNDFKSNLSIVLSLARIPFLGHNFRGCICIINYAGVEYRLATYLGVRVDELHDNKVIISQGNYSLEVDIKRKLGQKLKAPHNGDMNREIHEELSCYARFKFYYKDFLIFDFESNNASVEQAYKFIDEL